MIITMKTSIAGVDWSAGPGDSVDLPSDVARRMIAAGYATETATSPTTENAMKQAPSRRRKGIPNG